MPQRLHSASPDFEHQFAAFLAHKREAAADVEVIVRAIVADVRTRGDAAVLELTQRFDAVDLTTVGMRVNPSAIRRALEACDRDTLGALTLARDRITAHHERQRPRDDRYTDPLGVELGTRWTAVE